MFEKFLFQPHFHRFFRCSFNSRAGILVKYLIFVLDAWLSSSKKKRRRRTKKGWFLHWVWSESVSISVVPDPFVLCHLLAKHKSCWDFCAISCTIETSQLDLLHVLDRMISHSWAPKANKWPFWPPITWHPHHQERIFRRDIKPFQNIDRLEKWLSKSKNYVFEFNNIITYSWVSIS